MYVDPKHNEHSGNLRWILPYCKPDVLRLAIAIMLFILTNIAAFSAPMIAGLLVDKVITGGQHHLLIQLCLAMLAINLFRVTCRYSYQILMERFGQNSIYRLVSDEYEKLHQLDFSYFNHTRTGDVMSRMTSDTDAIRHFLSWSTYQITDCVVKFVGSLCVMALIEWRLAVTLALVTPFAYSAARSLSTHARPLFLEIRNSLARMNSMVEENIEGNRVVKAFVRDEYETKKFDDHNEDYYQRNIALAVNSRTYMPWLDGLGLFMQLLVLGFGGYLVMSGHMSLGDLVVFNSILWMVRDPVRQIGCLLNDWQRFNASCVKIRRLLTEESRIVQRPDATQTMKNARVIQERIGVKPKSVTQKNTDPAHCPSPHEISGEIRFDHVSFAFPDDPETPILKDIDLHVPAGSKLGILGETGAGKSTLINLIARFYDPTIGHVVIDGIDAKDWPLDVLRSEVSIVAQDTFLFSDTIESNISFAARSDRDAHFVHTMAAIAGADDFIRSMPEGYRTVVGERGVGLSGGQKQRLSLARALADDPSILIMDDTTSAVDMQTEAQIQMKLRELDANKTIVTIAHRISSVKDADLIVVLEDGRIVERGNHQELVANHGRYWEIYRKQLGMQSGQPHGF